MVGGSASVAPRVVVVAAVVVAVAEVGSFELLGQVVLVVGAVDDDADDVAVVVDEDAPVVPPEPLGACLVREWFWVLVVVLVVASASWAWVVAPELWCWLRCWLGSLWQHGFPWPC